jgi:hypothetical protein
VAVVKPDEVTRYTGQRVVLRLSPRAGGETSVTGRIVATQPAADGLVVTFEPDAAGSTGRRTYHYHYIEAIDPAP